MKAERARFLDQRERRTKPETKPLLPRWDKDCSSVDDSFGYWFAGFVDGEGCFMIRKNRKRWGQCGFYLGLRKDDLKVLRYIQKQLGFGKINYRAACFDKRTKSVQSPQANFSCYKKQECLNLVRVFEKFPLRSKKKRDFETWKRAVFILNQSNYGGYKPSEIFDLKLSFHQQKKFRRK